MAVEDRPQGSMVYQMFGPGSSGERPTVPEVTPAAVPEMDWPEFDESKVKRLAQEHAAPGIRTLREAYQTAAARLPTTPQARLTLKEALRGYGTGLESVMAGAKRTARAEVGEEFAIETAQAQQEFAAQLAVEQQRAALEQQRLLAQFEADYAEYMDAGGAPQTGGFYTHGGTWIPPGTPGPLGIRP